MTQTIHERATCAVCRTHLSRYWLLGLTPLCMECYAAIATEPITPCEDCEETPELNYQSICGMEDSRFCSCPYGAKMRNEWHNGGLDRARAAWTEKNRHVREKALSATLTVGDDCRTITVWNSSPTDPCDMYSYSAYAVTISNPDSEDEEREQEVLADEALLTPFNDLIAAGAKAAWDSIWDAIADRADRSF